MVTYSRRPSRFDRASYSHLDLSWAFGFSVSRFPFFFVLLRGQPCSFAWIHQFSLRFFTFLFALALRVWSCFVHGFVVQLIVSSPVLCHHACPRSFKSNHCRISLEPQYEFMVPIDQWSIATLRSLLWSAGGTRHGHVIC